MVAYTVSVFWLSFIVRFSRRLQLVASQDLDLDISFEGGVMRFESETSSQGCCSTKLSKELQRLLISFGADFVLFKNVL